MAAQPKTRLGQILVQAGVLTVAQLKQALSAQAELQLPLGHVLVSQGIIPDERPILDALQKHYRVPAVSLKEVEIPSELLALLPPTLALRHGMLPLKREGDVLTVAIMDPGDVLALDDAAYATKCRIQPVVASAEQLQELCKRHYGTEDLDSVVRGASTELRDDDPDRRRVEELESQNEQAPAVRLVSSALIQGIQRRASDIHVEPDERGLLIRYRIDGVLQVAAIMPASAIQPVTTRLKVMANLDVANRMTPQNGQIRTRLANKFYTMRVSTMPMTHGEKVVLRVLDREASVLDLSSMGMPAAVEQGFSDLLHRPQGIILVTGPTGSGKSTTLYAGITHIRSTETNIVTLEDPVEYEIAGIIQSHAGPEAHMSFAAGLRSLLRQDPDVILVGEIRDSETAQLAARAAMTGHLVLSTLHTNDAPGAVSRLVDLGVEPYLVSTTVIGVLAQRLVRRLCPQCKEPARPGEDDLRRIGFTEEQLAGAHLHEPRGCSHCSQTGYYGRLGVYELLTLNEPLRELISRNAPTELIRRAARDAGMASLRESGCALALEGLTSVSEVLRVTEHHDADTTLGCHRCGYPTQDHFLYCAACGHQLKTTCQQCGANVDTAWSHCVQCGAAAPEH